MDIVAIKGMLKQRYFACAGVGLCMERKKNDGLRNFS